MAEAVHCIHNSFTFLLSAENPPFSSSHLLYIDVGTCSLTSQNENYPIMNTLVTPFNKPNAILKNN